jgi:hypothetical protein
MFYLCHRCKYGFTLFRFLTFVSQQMFQCAYKGVGIGVSSLFHTHTPSTTHRRGILIYRLAKTTVINALSHIY